MPNDKFTVLLDAPGEPVSRIPIAKLGSYDDERYGKFTITANDVAEWQRNLEHLPGGRALIDEDHLANKPSPHRRTEASGWITGIDLDGNMAYASVEWTPKGRAAIAEKRYLFTSPTYGPYTDDAGHTHDNTLTGAALTNKPFLDMPMVTLASAENVQKALHGDPVVTRPETPAKLLDVPAWELLDKPERRGELDRAVRTLAREEGLPYLEALARFRDSWQRGRSARGNRGEPEAVGKVLERAGVDAPGETLKLLERRDSAVQRQLDAVLAPVADQKLDGMGRVMLGADDDVSRLLHNPEERDRRWRRARDLDQTYADRSTFDEADLLMLEGGVDILRSLERPLVIAEAHAQARATARELEQAIDAAVAPRQRAKQLDQAISALQGERATIQLVADPLDNDAKPEPGLHRLSRPSGRPPTFVELDGDSMMVALEFWDQHKATHSLDDSAAAISGVPVAPTGAEANLARSQTPGVADFTTGRIELHEAVVVYQEAHPGTGYVRALQQLT